MSDSFSSGPAPDGRLADAHAATAQAVRNGVTAVGVFGAPSTGKTALCEALATGVDERSFTATITDPSIDPDAFLLQLLSDFGLSAGTPTDGHRHDRHTLSAAVVRFLKSLKPLGAHALVIIDDAEQVGVDVYETVLQLAQAAGSDGNPLRLVLVGQSLLDARLAEPPLNEFPPNGQWTRVALNYDTPGEVEVPVTTSTLSAPSSVASPEVATAAPSPRGRASALAISPRLAALAALLALVAIGAWWVTSAPAPQSESGPPSAALAPAAPTPPVAGATAPAASATPPAPSAAPAAATGATSPGPVSAPAAKPAAATASSTAVTAAGATGSRESYRMVIASFRSAARAQQVVSDLQRQQLATTVRVDPTNTWHQVVAGPYPSIDAARQAQRAIERAGFADTQISLVPQTTNR